MWCSDRCFGNVVLVRGWVLDRLVEVGLVCVDVFVDVVFDLVLGCQDFLVDVWYVVDVLCWVAGLDEVDIIFIFDSYFQVMF